VGARPHDGVRAVQASQLAAEEGRFGDPGRAQFRPSGFFFDEVGEYVHMESFYTQVQFQAVSYDLEQAPAALDLETAARSNNGQGAEAATEQPAALLVTARVKAGDGLPSYGGYNLLGYEPLQAPVGTGRSRRKSR
jgi:hypothetical protein